MPTSLEEPRTPGAPVVKRTAIGQRFVGALVALEQRNVMKRDKFGEMRPVMKPDGIKAKQELVLTLIAMPGTTAPAGLGEVTAVPDPGDTVRLILRGGAFGEWIEAKKTHGPISTGDVVEQTTTHGQAYGADEKPTGPPLTTQAEIDALDRHQIFGIYGPLTLRSPTADETKWVELADAAHLAGIQRTVITDPGDDTEDPF